MVFNQILKSEVFNMKKFYNRIAKIAMLLNCDQKEIPYVIMVFVPENDYNKYHLLLCEISRIKSARYETNPYAQSIRVYHKDDYAARNESNDKKQKIVDFFFLELRKNGRDNKAAQKAQKAYAESIGAMAEYNAIYA